MKNKKKGQIAGQVFIYITAVIVIGTIALIGYLAIDKIIQKSCDAEEATFKMDIETYIETHTSSGSVYPEKISVPCGYDTICFVDASKIGTEIVCDNKIIWNSVKDGVQTNMFIIAGENTRPLSYSELITVSDAGSSDCLCITQRNDKFYITFNGKGSSTDISKT